jgi:pheromone a factor receptor
MSNIVFIVFTGLVLLLNIGPFYWQIQQRNSAAISMGFWVIVLNLDDFVRYSPLSACTSGNGWSWHSRFQVNNVVWFNDAVNRAPIWCDISNKVTNSTANMLDGPMTDRNFTRFESVEKSVASRLSCALLDF